MFVPIDHVVVGFRYTSDAVKLTIQETGGDPLSPLRTIQVVEPPAQILAPPFVYLMGKRLWSSGRHIMIGEEKLGQRIGFYFMSLYPGWEDVLERQARLAAWQEEKD